LQIPDGFSAIAQEGHRLIGMDYLGLQEFKGPSFRFTVPLVDKRRSSRAQARAVLGREFPLTTLSIVMGVPSPTLPHVSCAPSTMPDSEFSPVRLPAVASVDQPYPA